MQSALECFVRYCPKRRRIMEYILFFSFCASIGVVGLFDVAERRFRRKRKLKRISVVSSAKNAKAEKRAC